MNLWPVEHFFPCFFPDQCWSVLIWKKKRGTKVFNWSEVHFYRSNFLRNPYFNANNVLKVILLSIILRNIAYELKASPIQQHSIVEYKNSALELIDVTTRSDLNVIQIKRLKCGRRHRQIVEGSLRLTADPQLTSNLKPIVFHSTDYEEKGKYPKKAKYELYWV